jgi:hypothetical protein
MAERRETVIDPSPVHQAVEELTVEYEREIETLRAERDELRRKVEGN